MNLYQLALKVKEENIDIFATPMYATQSYFTANTGTFTNKIPTKVILKLREGKESEREFVENFFKNPEKIERYHNEGRQYTEEFQAYVNKFNECVYFVVIKNGVEKPLYDALTLFTITELHSFWENIHSALNFFFEKDKAVFYYKVNNSKNYNRHKMYLESQTKFIEGRMLYLKHQLTLLDNEVD